MSSFYESNIFLSLFHLNSLVHLYLQLILSFRTAARRDSGTIFVLNVSLKDQEPDLTNQSQLVTQAREDHDQEQPIVVDEVCEFYYQRQVMQWASGEWVKVSKL